MVLFYPRPVSFSTGMSFFGTSHRHCGITGERSISHSSKWWYPNLVSPIRCALRTLPAVAQCSTLINLYWRIGYHVLDANPALTTNLRLTPTPASEILILGTGKNVVHPPPALKMHLNMITLRRAQLRTVDIIVGGRGSQKFRNFERAAE